MSRPIGLDGEGLKTFAELCIKANEVQLRAMEDHIIKEMDRRNYATKE